MKKEKKNEFSEIKEQTNQFWNSCTKAGPGISE